MIAANKERAAATCMVVSDHQIVRPPALTFRAPYRCGPTGLPNALGVAPTRLTPASSGLSIVRSE
jgi:hypothetical protein